MNRITRLHRQVNVAASIVARVTTWHDYIQVEGKMVAERFPQPRLCREQPRPHDRRQPSVGQLHTGCGPGKSTLFSPSTPPVLSARFRNAEQFDDAGRRQGG
jgi:hypothetical protein